MSLLTQSIHLCFGLPLLLFTQVVPPPECGFRHILGLSSLHETNNTSEDRHNNFMDNQQCTLVEQKFQMLPLVLYRTVIASQRGTLLVRCHGDALLLRMISWYSGDSAVRWSMRDRPHLIRSNLSRSSQRCVFLLIYTA